LAYRVKKSVDHLLCYAPEQARELALAPFVERYGPVNGYQCIQCGSTLYGKARRWCNGKSGAECRRMFFAK